jgi:superfamily I DNA/RNA helicase
LCSFVTLLDALKQMSRCALRARTLAQRKLRVMNRIITAHIDPTSTKIKVLNMHANKALEFLVVVLPGAGHMPAVREVEKEAARATQRLALGFW